MSFAIIACNKKINLKSGYDLNKIDYKTEYEFWIAEVPGRPSGYPRAVYGKQKITIIKY